MSYIIDGTGTGRRAGVTDENRLKTETISEDTYVHAAEEGRAFNINTELRSYTTGTETPVLYVKNNESVAIEMVGWFIGESNRTGADTTSPAIFKMYGTPTSGTIQTNGIDVPVVNRRIGDPREFAIVAKRNSGLDTVAFSSDALLYQVHSGGRAFGTVNFTVPAGASIVITVDVLADEMTFYTGFTGYIS